MALLGSRSLGADFPIQVLVHPTDAGAVAARLAVVVLTLRIETLKIATVEGKNDVPALGAVRDDLNAGVELAGQRLAAGVGAQCAGRLIVDDRCRVRLAGRNAVRGVENLVF